MPAGTPNKGAASRTLTAEQVVELRAAYRAGVSTPTLQARSGFRGHASLSAMLQGRTYGWVPGAILAHEVREPLRRRL